LKSFLGYHSEWNLGSPGGWDYQRVTQIIGKAVWQKIQEIRAIPVDLDFDHPFLFPVYGFVEMLVQAHRSRSGNTPGLIAVVAEEETLEDVTENINLARHLDRLDGIEGVLLAPQALEAKNGVVCYRGRAVSLAFLDFNSDVLLSLHRKHDLSPLLQLVREGRVLNPRGTEPINVKSMFEVLTGDGSGRFHPEITRRTPWTRRFHPRSTRGPRDQRIDDLIEWTRDHWNDLVLKPERGYSGRGVRVGETHPDAEEAIRLALAEGNYIVQEKIPLPLWAEEIPTLHREDETIRLERYQTDFRCLMGHQGLLGFLGRYGGVPTNVGSGGGVQPLAVLRSPLSVRDAVERVNEALLSMDYGDLEEVLRLQERLAVDHRFTYLLGPIKIALRPRIIRPEQIEALARYCEAMWLDCLELEKMWLSGELDDIIRIEPEELEIARMQPWKGQPAIIASDGLFSFGAHPEKP